MFIQKKFKEVSSPVDVTINSSLPRNSLAFAQQPPQASNQAAFYFCLYYHSLILSCSTYTPGGRPLLLEGSVDHSSLGAGPALCITKLKAHRTASSPGSSKSTSQHLATEGRNTDFPPRLRLCSTIPSFQHRVSSCWHWLTHRLRHLPRFQ